MAMRKIGVGTLVSVEQESTGRGRRRPSEGGIGFVVKRKKQRRMEDKNGETPVVELTQQSTTSTTTAGTGATMFDICYSLDGRLSQEVNKNRVRVGMLGTTARQRNGSREVRPSLLTASTTTTTNNNNTSHNNNETTQQQQPTQQRNNNYNTTTATQQPQHNNEKTTTTTTQPQPQHRHNNVLQGARTNQAQTPETPARESSSTTPMRLFPFGLI